MVKKFCLGWVVALAGLYGVHSQALAVHPLVGYATTTTVVASPNPQEQGHQVLFTATVALSSTPTPAPTQGPSGTVDFSDNGSAISGCQGAALANGTASCQTPFSVPGNHLVKAVYSGSADLTYSGSQQTVTEQVTATPSSFSLGSQSADPYPTSVYSGGSAAPIPSYNSSPGNFTPLPSSPTESTIPYQPPSSPSSTTPGSGSNLLAIVVIIVVVLLIISAGAITLLLVVK